MTGPTSESPPHNGTIAALPSPAPAVEPQAYTGIPITDPQEALKFCQALARMISNGNGHAATLVVSTPAPAPAPYARPMISVVTPVYNEEENLPALYARLTAVLDGLGHSYEIVFVDDGSRDRSLELLHGLALQDRRIVVVELARNFGHQVAISAGLDYARGAGVVVMDADLQDPPEVLPQFIAKWQEGHDVVYAIREQRKEIWLKRVAYRAFYRLLQRVANIEIPLDAGDFCIMDRRVVDLLVGMPERTRFVRGIRSWVGLNQVGLAYARHARYAGASKYTFTRLIYLALDGLVSFSFMPLRAISVLGMIVSLFSLIIALFYTIQKLTVGLTPPGFATLVVSVFFLAGIQLITIGVIGEYVGRIFEEVKRRPLYVVRRVSASEQPARVHDRRL